MRMKYMYYLTKNNYDAISSATIGSRKIGTSGAFYEIANWASAVLAFDNLSQIPFFTADINKIFGLQVGMRNHTKAIETISEDLGIQYNILQNRIVTQMRAIIEFCEAAGFDEYEQGFDVKMPPASDITVFSKYIKGLEFVLTQCPYLNIEGERLELKKTDAGSIWFEFIVIAASSAVLLFNLSKLVDMCAKISSHITTVKQQKEMLRASKMKNDELEKRLLMLDDFEDLYYKNAIVELESDIGKLKNGEDEQRAIKSIKELSGLMSLGMEIIASIDSPKEIKDLFPTSENFKSLPGTPKLLSDKSEQSE